MFRKMRRFKQEMPKEEAIKFLKEETKGFLAINGEYPYVVPMSYLYEDGKIYFHMAHEGHKLDLINKDNKVSFSVCDEGISKDGSWILDFKSVIAFGRLKEIKDRDEARKILRVFAAKYNPYKDKIEGDIDKSIKVVVVYEMEIDHISGKFVKAA